MSQVLYLENGVRYEILDEMAGGDMVEVCAEAFTGREPMTVVQEIKSHVFKRFVRTIVPKIVQDGVSVLARDEATGQVLGMMVNEDLGSSADPPEPPPDPFIPIFGFLENLSSFYLAQRELNPGELLHLFMLAVRDSAVGRGLGERLTKISLELAIRRGFREGIAEATSAPSQHIMMNKLGFKSIKQMAYADYLHEGKPIFKSIDHPATAILAHTELDQFSGI